MVLWGQAICLLQRHVHVVQCGRQQWHHSQIAHSASSQSSTTLLALHVEHTTAVRFLTSNLYSDLLKQIDVEIDVELLELAFTHRSFAYEAGLTATNERLEFLGGVTVTSRGFERRLSATGSSMVK